MQASIWRHDTDSRVSKMILGVEKKLLWPAFLMGVLAIFLSRTNCAGAKRPKTCRHRRRPGNQSQHLLRSPEPEVIETLFKTTSNLVMVPVSVTDQTGPGSAGTQGR